jgi:hypothetical protein
MTKLSSFLTEKNTGRVLQQNITFFRGGDWEAMIIYQYFLRGLMVNEKFDSLLVKKNSIIKS